MMKISRLTLIAAVLIAASFLVACAAGTTAPVTLTTPTLTLTPNPCAPENIKAKAQKVNHLMREFDDAAVLASNTARTEISAPIAGLQRIRREAEDLEVPDCLAKLRSYEVVHMNLVINTLIAFMGGAEQKVTNQGITLARQQHDIYMLELARVLGITVVAPSPTPTAPAETPTPAGSPASVSAADASNSPGLIITVSGPTNVNLRKTPTLDGETLGKMNIGDSARLVGKTNDGTWLLIEVPGQPGVTAWVYSPLVTISGPTDNLPIITPTP